MREKKPRIKKEVLFSIVIAALMVFSVFGIVLSNITNTQKLKYNNYIFYLTEKGWNTKINNKNLYFTYSPEQLENLNISQDILELTKGKIQVDITYDFNDSFSEKIAYTIFDMQQKLNEKNIYLRDGFTTNTTYNKPIITCQDANELIPVIYIKKSDEMNTSLNNNCIIIEIKSTEELFAVKDKLTYAMLGVV